jgi:hypothetical protein
MNVEFLQLTQFELDDAFDDHERQLSGLGFYGYLVKIRCVQSAESNLNHSSIWFFIRFKLIPSADSNL